MSEAGWLTIVGFVLTVGLSVATGAIGFIFFLMMREVTRKEAAYEEILDRLKALEDGSSKAVLDRLEYLEKGYQKARKELKKHNIILPHPRDSDSPLHIAGDSA